MSLKYALELFSGSKSVSRELKKLGYEVISLDWNSKLKPSICCDILEFPYSKILVPISLIWGSPDCSKLSRQAPAGQWKKTTLKYRIYEYSPLCPGTVASLAYVDKTIEIIKFYNPPVWFIENPVGRMRHIPSIKNFVPYRYSVNYKDYGFSYSKETDIFTNQLYSLSVKKVIRPGRGVNSLNSSFSRSVVPPALVNYLVTHANL